VVLKWRKSDDNYFFCSTFSWPNFHIKIWELSNFKFPTIIFCADPYHVVAF
jgi:hypothetical protein